MWRTGRALATSPSDRALARFVKYINDTIGDDDFITVLGDTVCDVAYFLALNKC